MGRQPGRQLMRGAILTAIAVLVGSQTVDAAAATSGSQLRSAPKALLLAQVGSTGGSIGKQDKSLSGDRPQSSSPAAEQPRRSPPPEKRPAAASGRGNYDGVWATPSVGATCTDTTTGTTTVRGGRLYGANGGSGSVSGSGAVRGSFVANGITVTYAGRLSGRSGGGTFVRSDGCSGRWSAVKQ